MFFTSQAGSTFNSSNTYWGSLYSQPVLHLIMNKCKAHFHPSTVCVIDVPLPCSFATAVCPPFPPPPFLLLLPQIWVTNGLHLYNIFYLALAWPTVSNLELRTQRYMDRRIQGSNHHPTVSTSWLYLLKHSHFIWKIKSILSKKSSSLCCRNLTFGLWCCFLVWQMNNITIVMRSHSPFVCDWHLSYTNPHFCHMSGFHYVQFVQFTLQPLGVGRDLQIAFLRFAGSSPAHTVTIFAKNPEHILPHG